MPYNVLQLVAVAKINNLTLQIQKNMQNLIIDEITKAVWNEFTAKTHNEKRDYQYSVNDLRNVITEAYKNAEALQLKQTGVNKCI